MTDASPQSGHLTDDSMLAHWVSILPCGADKVRSQVVEAQVWPRAAWSQQPAGNQDPSSYNCEGISPSSARESFAEDPSPAEPAGEPPALASTSIAA